MDSAPFYKSILHFLLSSSPPADDLRSRIVVFTGNTVREAARWRTCHRLRPYHGHAVVEPSVSPEARAAWQLAARRPCLRPSASPSGEGAPPVCPWFGLGAPGSRISHARTRAGRLSSIGKGVSDFMATIAVIGAGIGGLAAAIGLRKALGPEHRVIVVERETVQGFHPSLLWVLDGRRAPKDITRSLDAIKRRGIALVHDTAMDIDMASRVVRCEREKVPYDFLILAPGADHALERIPGLVRGPVHPMSAGSARTVGPVFNLFSIEGVLGLRGALETAEGGDILVVAPPGLQKCPPVLSETAMIIDRVLRRAGKRGRFAISAFSPENLPFEAAGAAVGRLVVRTMARRAVSYYGNWHLESVDTARKVAVFTEGSAAYDILAFLPPIRVPEFVRRAGLSSGDDGFVEVDPGYLSVSGPAAPDSARGKDRVFAIGDVTSIPMPRGGFVPKSGAIAHLQSLVVVGNISALVRGKSPARRFSGTAMCVIEMGDLAPITAVGNFLARSGDFKVLPRLRTFVSIKAAIERKWLSERE